MREGVTTTSPSSLPSLTDTASLFSLALSCLAHQVGVGSTCVIAAPGIINTFGLTTNFPSAIATLRKCKTLVGNPTACDA